MSEKTIKTRIRHKHAVEADWLKAVNFVPLEGEIIVYSPDETYSYARFKIGDGNTNVNSLQFVGDDLAARIAKIESSTLSPEVLAELQLKIDNEKLRAETAEGELQAGIDSVTNTNNAHIDNTSNPHGVTKSQIGLGNVDNTPDIDKPISVAQQNALNLKIDIAKMGSADGVATLNDSGKIPAAQLPSYVDDVVEYADRDSFPTEGESGKIYIDMSANSTYRWSGSTYVSIGSSVALGETSSTAYPGDKGAQNAASIAALRDRTANIESKNASQDSAIDTVQAKANSAYDLAASKADDDHTHIIENVDGLQDALDDKASSGHNHDSAYAAKTHSHEIANVSGLQTQLDGKAASGHTHDDRYYTEGEVDAKLVNKSDTGHTHDDRYYTEGEVDAKLANKSDTGHTHTVVNGVTPEWSGSQSSASWLCAWNSDGTKIKAIATSNVSIGYANSAGSANAVAWGNVSGKPSTYTPSSHTHSYAGSSSAGGAATNALALDGASASESASNSTIVKRTSSGYINATFFNQSSGTETPTTSSFIMYANSDGYLRKSTLANVKSILGLGSAAYTASTAYAAASHSHSYAGAGSSGGSATSAVKLDTATAGSATQPVYFSGGKPTACTYTLGKSVPSNAVFTDTNTWRGIQNNLTSDSTSDSLSAAQGKALKALVDGKAASSHTHTKANISDFPSSLPANGGNADTVDGQHFSYSNSSNSPAYLWATNSSGTSFLAERGSISVNYANYSGYVSNALSIKVGGTTISYNGSAPQSITLSGVCLFDNLTSKDSIYCDGKTSNTTANSRTYTDASYKRFKVFATFPYGDGSTEVYITNISNGYHNATSFGGSIVVPAWEKNSNGRTINSYIYELIFTITKSSNSWIFRCERAGYYSMFGSGNLILTDAQYSAASNVTSTSTKYIEYRYRPNGDYRIYRIEAFTY